MKEKKKSHHAVTVDIHSDASVNATHRRNGREDEGGCMEPERTRAKKFPDFTAT